jgi:hypothetical protein
MKLVKEAEIVGAFAIEPTEPTGGRYALLGHWGNSILVEGLRAGHLSRDFLLV